MVTYCFAQKFCHFNGRVAVFEAKYAKSLNDLDTACEKAVQQMDDLMYAKSFEDDYDEDRKSVV